MISIRQLCRLGKQTKPKKNNKRTPNSFASSPGRGTRDLFGQVYKDFLHDGYANPLTITRAEMAAEGAALLAPVAQSRTTSNGEFAQVNSSVNSWRREHQFATAQDSVVSDLRMLCRTMLDC